MTCKPLKCPRNLLHKNKFQGTGEVGQQLKPHTIFIVDQR